MPEFDYISDPHNARSVSAQATRNVDKIDYLSNATHATVKVISAPYDVVGDNQDPKDGDNIWVSKSGFGGTEYLLSGLYSEGSKRGMSLNHMAQLVCKNPAERYGLLNKGDIAVGYDADLVLLDPDETFTVRAAESESTQGYTPFEGVELTGRVKSTYLRGQLIYDNGNAVGEATGQYLSRPTQRPVV